MTQTPPEPLEPESDSQTEWNAIVAGKRLPNSSIPEHAEAEAVRQALLWRHAKSTALTVSPTEAERLFKQLHVQLQIEKVSSWQRWGRGIIWSSSLILMGFGAGYGVVKWTESTQTNPATQPTIETSATLALPALSTLNHKATNPATLSDLPSMLTIPSGSYRMGCSAGWDDDLGGCRDNEFPAHSVTLPSFELSKYEVTVGQFKRFVAETQYKTTAEQTGEGCTVTDPKLAGKWVLHPASNWRSPGFAQTDVHPVVCISWQDTQQYIQWLNKTTSQAYRLPTEEEWEYAARGGKVTAFAWGSQPSRNFANYQGQGELDQWQYTAPVGQFSSNAYGLHDMAGNVWEWVDNCWRANYLVQTMDKSECEGHLRTRRGGAWDNQPPNMRPAYRSSGNELERSFLYGFRVARSLP
ncbi:MAG: hypothetical protein RLZZ422_2383 [Pseudomonadota bacterium]|jgi:formylglycine-generating enzyme required for sulfatase activity